MALAPTHRCDECRQHPWDGVLHVVGRPYPPGDPDALVATENVLRGSEHWYERQLETFPVVGGDERTDDGN